MIFFQDHLVFLLILPKRFFSHLNQNVIFTKNTCEAKINTKFSLVSPFLKEITSKNNLKTFPVFLRYF